jgi:hypothetical protein
MAKELSLVGQHLDALVDDLRAMFAIKQASKQGGEQSELEILNKADAAWRLHWELPHGEPGDCVAPRLDGSPRSSASELGFGEIPAHTLRSDKKE